MYTRLLTSRLKEKLFQGKALIITGARQTGKTTIAQDLCSPQQTRFFNADNPSDRELLSNKDLDFLVQLIGDKQFIFIDEGQKIETIGQTVKLLVDFYKNTKQIIVTGSSSIHLLDHTQEALTGRKFVFQLFPLSLQEIYPNDLSSVLKNLETLLIFGSYPEVVTKNNFEDKQDLLRELSSSTLYQDIFEFQQVKNPILLRNLLKALALQVGSTVSLTELSKLLSIDQKTVERYIDLLEKNFVIFRLPPFTTKKRREIIKQKKIYFYDLGIRNAMLGNFLFLDQRNDIGALWENFLAVERLKYLSYHNISAHTAFWRTYDGAEIDWIEERDGKLFAYEFKWNPKKRSSPPAIWQSLSESSYDVIDRERLHGFVL